MSVDRFRPVRVLATLLVAAMLGACQPPAAKTADETAAKAAPNLTKAERPMGPNTVSGVITKVEDSGYPSFNVYVDAGDPAGPLQLYFNNEAADIVGGAEIGSLVAKRVEVQFNRAQTLDVVSLTRDGKELLYREPGTEVAKADLTVTGVLSGAGALTESDLPDELTVTDAAGKAHKFEHYISEDDLLKANGKTVTAGFVNEISQEITSIKPIS